MSLRIGLVGAGANTRERHIPGFQAIEGVEVVAVCNRTVASARNVADEFGISNVFDDWKALVHSDTVDAVCVGTWPYMHCPITIESLAADKHVLTEARMCMNLDEARRMLVASQQSKRVSMIVPAPSYLETEGILLEMVEEGIFGDWLDINVRLLSGGYNPDAPLHWRQRRDLSGNNIMSMGIAAETVHRYAGTERSVIALGKIFTPERLDLETGQKLAADVPESLGVVSEMVCGATATYHLSSVTRAGEGESFRMHGTRGACKLEGGKAWVADEDADVFRELVVPPERQGGWRVEADFVDAIRDGKAVTHTNFADGLNYMIFTEAVQISMLEGRRVDLPLD